jgi:hypothetical protein
MGRVRLARQVGGLAILVAALSLCLAALVAAATPTADLRGEWAASAKVGSTTYAQTLHITTEDFTTGQVGGTDQGADGSTYTLAGQIVGATLTMTLSNATYQSNTSATILGTGGSLRLSGTFSDTNHNSGTFSASLSIPATSPPASALTTVTPAAATISATVDGQAATVTSTPPTDPGPANDLPLIAIGLAAVLVVGLGAAAATGRLPGVGLGGSGTGSGGGQADASTGGASTSTPPPQIERAKLQQDARTSIMPTLQDIPARPAPAGAPDAGLDPAGQAPDTSGQQIERAKLQQDARTSIMPTLQDIPARPARAGAIDAGLDPAGQAGESPNTAPSETIGPASAVPIDAPPTA